MEPLKLKHILTLYAGGASNREIARQTDVAKATVDMYIKRLRESQIDILDALALKPEILLERLTINRSANIGYRLPDYEADYIRYHRKGKARKTLKELWQEYCRHTPSSELSLGYKAYTKGMDRFIKNLPEHLTEYSLTNQWAPADVMMIDYSGDKMQITDSNTGEKIPVDIFVAVLANSGYIFCMATPHQRRDDWIDAQIAMMDFFGGATRHIFLDNSTSLVRVQKTMRSWIELHLTVTA